MSTTTILVKEEVEENSDLDSTFQLYYLDFFPKISFGNNMCYVTASCTSKIVMLWAIWYLSCNLQNLKITNGEVLFLVKLQADYSYHSSMGAFHVF